MREFKQILCPIDFSDFSAKALWWALSIAQRYRADLSALHVLELWRHNSINFALSPSITELRQGLVERASARLLEFVRDHNPDSFPVESLLFEGMAPDGILEVAQEKGADLIVMGTHGRRGFDRLMIGSVAERIIRNATCPVLAVRVAPQSDSIHDTPPCPFSVRQILCCVDFSDFTMPSLECAMSMAWKYDMNLILLHVIEEGIRGESQSQAAISAREELDRLVPPAWEGRKRLSLAVRSGKPYVQIKEFAAEVQAGVAVMGVRGRSIFDFSVFGSTTHRMIQLGPCPVLVVNRQ